LNSIIGYFNDQIFSKQDFNSSFNCIDGIGKVWDLDRQSISVCGINYKFLIGVQCVYNDLLILEAFYESFNFSEIRDHFNPQLERAQLELLDLK